MKINYDKKYKLDSNILNKYVKSINIVTGPMNQINFQIKNYTELIKEYNNEINEELLEIIKKMYDLIAELSYKYPNEQGKILISVIKQIMQANNGIISSRMISPLNISRQYLSVLEKNGEIEKISRGIYQLPEIFEDSYYAFQSTYKKVIFSHMNALYFWKMTEEVPYNYTVTVPQNYHANGVNEKCNVFYVDDELINLGLCEVNTPNGNKVRTYDVERSICDIFRSKNRMDPEQVKKSIGKYLKSKNKNLNKLYEYSKKMGIKEQLVEMIGAFNE